MLVLSRRKGQSVRIGDAIEVVVTALHRSSCKLAIRAPAHLLVSRGEVVMAKRSENEPLESAPVVDAKAAGGGAPCPHHDASACCTECPDHRATDGRGFPHPSERRGRAPLQRCLGCRQLRNPDEWTHDIGRARFGCVACYPPPAP